jgi:ABC-type sulfate/molybdate transport systems ATPase subunit
VEETLSKLDLSMVLVTHDRGQASRLAERVVRLEDGVVR